jgi:hypothetical protein
MEDKIYEKLKEQEIESATRYIKILGASYAPEITDLIPKKNIDFATILNRMGLIELTQENREKINDFHDYLFKLGINLGVSHGKKMIIDAVKDDDIDFQEILDVNPEDLVDFNMEPTFIRDYKEAVVNEK